MTESVQIFAVFAVICVAVMLGVSFGNRRK